MAFLSSPAIYIFSSASASLRRPTSRRRCRTPYRYTVVRCATLSPEEARKKELLAAEAAISRRNFEESAVTCVLSDGNTNRYEDGRYGNCTSCGAGLAIPGLSHSLCPSCGWVRRPKVATKEEEEPKLDGHHD